MRNDNVFEIKKPEPFVDDQITQIIRQGARKLLAQALEVEIELFINQSRGTSFNIQITLEKCSKFKAGSQSTEGASIRSSILILAS